jgi:hypothetical protein
MSKASAKVKGELPGRTKEAEKRGEAWASEAGAKIDSTVRVPLADPKLLLSYLRSPSKTSQITFIAPEPAFAISNSGIHPTYTPQVDKARAEAAKAEGKLEQYSKDAKKATMKEVDAFDRTVEKKASEAKSGISSWFGGK